MAFDQGDAVAKEIFDHNINQQLEMVEAVIRRLKLEAVPTDCVLVGSITKIAYVQTNLTAKLKEKYPQLSVVIPSQAPVYGALKMALKQ
jgi:N-acetylglucosamine kinase-like BadF-type ATPase